MPKARKSDSDKAPKDKIVKAPKAEKPAKEKKKEKDKAKPIEIKIEKKLEKKPAVKAKKVVEPEASFTTEEIALRAYFIAERRDAMGWPGDSTSDWIEAERQLKAEARRKARA